MRGRIGSGLVFLFFLLADTGVINAACIDPGRFAHSTVSIARYFDDAERAANRGLAGVQGTAWFISPTTIVTAEHVAAAMTLSAQEWKVLEIAGADGTQSIAARLRRLAGVRTERLAIIELQHAVSDARSFTIRTEPLVPEEPVMALAYPAGRPQFVSGRFVRLGDDGKLAGLALLELYEGDNRLIIDHGASGAPVVDCSGRVVAIVSNVFTQSIYWANREIRISTAWGMPNVVSVPVQALGDSSEAN
jgi:S1-C subfamily serine protease